MSEFFSLPLRLREMRPTQMAWCGVLLWISTVVLPEQAAQKLRLLSAFQEYQAPISLCGMGCAAYLCGLLLGRIAHAWKQYSKYRRHHIGWVLAHGAHHHSLPTLREICLPLSDSRAIVSVSRCSPLFNGNAFVLQSNK